MADKKDVVSKTVKGERMPSGPKPKFVNGGRMLMCRQRNHRKR